MNKQFFQQSFFKKTTLLTTLIATSLALVACPSNDAGKDPYKNPNAQNQGGETNPGNGGTNNPTGGGTNNPTGGGTNSPTADANLINTYWHKGYFYIYDDKAQKTKTYIEIPNSERFGVIANNGQAAFVFLAGNTGIPIDRMLSLNALGLAIGKVSGNKFEGKFYEMSTLGEGKTVKVNGTEIQMNDVEPITQTFSLAKDQTDYTKKIANEVDYNGLKFKGEANNLDSLKVGKLKEAGKNYGCVVEVDGEMLGRQSWLMYLNTKVESDGLTLTHKNNQGAINDQCSYELKLTKLHEQAEKPTQYTATASLECKGKEKDWLAASDYKGLAVAYNGNKLITYLASNTKNKGVIIECN